MGDGLDVDLYGVATRRGLGAFLMRGGIAPADVLGIGSGIHDFLLGSIKGMATFTWGFIKSAFSASDINGSWWVSVVGGKVTTVVGNTATEVTHPGMVNVIVLIMVPFLLLLAAVQVVISLFRQSTLGLVRAVVACFFAVPVTYIVVGMMYTLMVLFDQISQWILVAGGGGDDEAMSAILALFGMTWNPAKQEVLLDESYQQWKVAFDTGNPGGIMFPFIICLLIVFVAFIMMCMMVYRTMALVIMASLTPIAVMSQSLDVAKGILSKWGSTVLGLLIAKPAAAVIIKMGMVLSSTSDQFFQMAAGILAMLMAAAMPILAGKFTGFVGAGGDGVNEGGGHMLNGAGRRGGRVLSGGGRRVSRAGGSARRSVSRGVRRLSSVGKAGKR